MPEINPMLQFIDTIMAEAGLDNLSDETKKFYREKLAEESQKRLAIMALSHLKGKAAEKYVEVVSQNPDNFDAIMDFFRENIPDFEQKMADQLAQFGREFIEITRKMQS